MRFRPAEVIIALFFVALFAGVLWLGSAAREGAQRSGSQNSGQTGWSEHAELHGENAISQQPPSYSFAESETPAENSGLEKIRELKKQQRQYVLPEFIKASDKDIARLQHDIEAAKAQRVSVQEIALQEEKLLRMQQLRQQVLARNADLAH